MYFSGVLDGEQDSRAMHASREIRRGNPNQTPMQCKPKNPNANSFCSRHSTRLFWHRPRNMADIHAYSDEKCAHRVSRSVSSRPLFFFVLLFVRRVDSAKTVQDRPGRAPTSHRPIRYSPARTPHTPLSARYSASGPRSSAARVLEDLSRCA